MQGRTSEDHTFQGVTSSRKELSRAKALVKKHKDGNLSSFDLVQHFNSWFGSNKFKMKRMQLKKAKQYVKCAIEETYCLKK